MKKLLVLAISALMLTGCFGGEEKVVLNCEEGMNDTSVKGTSLRFCADPAWGDVVVEDLSDGTDDYVKISFANSENPRMMYQSLNYEGEGKIPYNAREIRITGTDDDLLGQMKGLLNVNGTDMKVRKSDVFGQRAVRLHHLDEVQYIIPIAFREHTLIISADDAEAELLDELVYDFVY